MKFLVSHLELKDRTYYVMYIFWWIYELSGCGFESSCSHLIFLSVDGKSTAVFNLDWYKLQLTAQLRNAEYKKLVRQTCIACSLECCSTRLKCWVLDVNYMTLWLPWLSAKSSTRLFNPASTTKLATIDYGVKNSSQHTTRTLEIWPAYDCNVSRTGQHTTTILKKLVSIGQRP